MTVNEYALGINIVNASNMHDKVVYTKVLESTFFFVFQCSTERERELSPVPTETNSLRRGSKF